RVPELTSNLRVRSNPARVVVAGARDESRAQQLEPTKRPLPGRSFEGVGPGRRRSYVRLMAGLVISLQQLFARRFGVRTGRNGLEDRILHRRARNRAVIRLNGRLLLPHTLGTPSMSASTCRARNGWRARPLLAKHLQFTNERGKPSTGRFLSSRPLARQTPVRRRPDATICRVLTLSFRRAWP